jgi:CubicO group peptidase (beta-lactamase class C family)
MPLLSIRRAHISASDRIGRRVRGVAGPLALLAASLTLPLSSPLVAQRAVAPNGFDAARLARIDSTLQRLVTQQKIPGAVAMITRNGRVVYQKAFGVRDLGTGAPQRTDDIFRLASQTKAVTSLAAMILWEEGKFQLDDPVSLYLPEFRTMKVLTKFNAADSSYESRPAARRMTIRQLFTHTSGLDYPSIGSEEFRAIYAKAGVPSGIGTDGAILADKMRVLATLPLKHEPGERFTYGLSVDVLGRLVEVLSGMPLDEFFRTRIFVPLKMNDTWFALPKDKQARLVALHAETEGKLSASHTQTTDVHPDYPNRNIKYFSGGAGLSGPIADYARFLQMFLNGGELDGVRILGPKTVDMMLTNQIGTLQPAFGLGFAVETAQGDFSSPASIGTFNWGGAFATTYWADPKEQIVALVYTNIYGSTARVGEIFKTLVYSAMK